MNRGISPYSEVTAMILAGGLGTRLRSVVPDTQKVVAPVGGKPFLTRHLDALARLGVSKVILCTGYKSEQVEAQYGSSYRGMTLTYSVEEAPKGTGGALVDAASLLTTEQALVINGDSFAELDYDALWDFHVASSQGATVALFSVDDTTRYGTVEVELETGTVTSFREKERSKGRGLVNGGVYLISRELLLGIATSRPLSLEREVFPFWIKLGVMRGFRDDNGSFLDIGTPESYREAHMRFSEQREDKR